MQVVSFEVATDGRTDTRFVRLDTPPAAAEPRFRVGLVAPSANCVVEDEIHRIIGEAAALVTSRAAMSLGATWSNDSELHAAVAKIHDHYEGAIAAFQGQTIDHLIIGDAGFFLPMAGHEALHERLTPLIGRPPTLAVFAYLELFAELGARRMATITPRQPLSGVVSGGIWEENGLTVTGVGDLQCASADDIASTTPDRVLALAHDLARDRPDVICVTGTNIALTTAIPKIREAIGIPILHITDVLAAHALKTLGLPHAAPWSQA